MTLNPDERDALARWVRVVKGSGYMAAQIDKEILPVLERALDEAPEDLPDPYAGKRQIMVMPSKTARKP